MMSNLNTARGRVVVPVVDGLFVYSVLRWFEILYNEYRSSPPHLSV